MTPPPSPLFSEMGRRFLDESYFLNKRPYKADFICKGCNALKLSVVQKRLLKKKENQLPRRERLTQEQTELLYQQGISSRGIDVRLFSLKNHSNLPHEFPSHLDFTNYSSEILINYCHVDNFSHLNNYECARFFKPETRGSLFLPGGDELTLESERYFRFLQYIYMDAPSDLSVHLRWSN